MDLLRLHSLIPLGEAMFIDLLRLTAEGRLWAGSSARSALLALDLRAGTTAQNRDPSWLGTDRAPHVFHDLTPFESDGQDLLLVAGGGALRLRGTRANGDSNARALLEDGQDRPLSVSVFTRFERGDDSFLLASNGAGEGLTLYQISPDHHSAAALDSVSDTPKSTLSGVSDILSVTVAGTRFALVSSGREDGLSSYAITGENRLALRDTLGPKDGLWVNGLEAITALTTGGQQFIVGVSSLSGSVSVVRINAMGAMFITDVIHDSLLTRFGGARTLASFDAQDRSFVVVAGNDGGLALLELLPGGQLFHHQSLTQTTDWTLGPIVALEAQIIGQEVQIFASGTHQTGLAQITLPLGDLGPLTRGDGGNNRIEGGAQDDLIMGLWGNDTLRGQDGDDTLIAGPGADRLHGGAGADVFVFTADGDRNRIDDFQPGQDRIHLDDWGMIYDISALQIRATNWGSRISWRGERIDVHTADNSRLTPEDWRAEDFIF